MDGGQPRPNSQIFGFIELGIIPVMSPSPTFQDKRYFFHIESPVSHFAPTHREKEELSQLMYTIEGKTFLLKEKVLTFFVFQIVVKHSYVKFVLTTQKIVCSISISIVIFLCCQI